MPSRPLLATADLLAPGRDPQRPRVQLFTYEAAPDPHGRARCRHEILIDRGTGTFERFALTLPADAVALVGRALVEAGQGR